MVFRFSPHARPSEQSNELAALKQDNSPDLTARFLELKRLRHEVRVAQCGRVACWDERLSVEKSRRGRRLANNQ
jgi:hypothetical protein